MSNYDACVSQLLKFPRIVLFAAYGIESIEPDLKWVVKSFWSSILAGIGVIILETALKLVAWIYNYYVTHITARRCFPLWILNPPKNAVVGLRSCGNRVGSEANVTCVGSTEVAYQVSITWDFAHIHTDHRIIGAHRLQNSGWIIDEGFHAKCMRFEHNFPLNSMILYIFCSRL